MKPNSNGWKSIETAPLNQDVLVYGGGIRLETESSFMDFEGVTIAWKRGEHWISGEINRKAIIHEPTHWMNLPEAPK